MTQAHFVLKKETLSGRKAAAASFLFIGKEKQFSSPLTYGISGYSQRKIPLCFYNMRQGLRNQVRGQQII